MKARTTLVPVLAALLGLGQAAVAGELYTPPISGQTGGTCALINLGSTTKEVRIEVRDGSTGGIISSVDTIAEPGKIAQFSLTASFVSTAGYCAFFFEGPRREVRAGFYARSSDNRLIAAVRAE